MGVVQPKAARAYCPILGQVRCIAARKLAFTETANDFTMTGPAAESGESEAVRHRLPVGSYARRLVPLLYFLVVSLPHHPVSSFYEKEILIPAGFYSVNHALDIITIVVLAGVLALAIRVARVHGRVALEHLALWLALVVLMFLADRYLIVNNVERIHFPQYAILAVLLGFSLRSEMLIFFVASFAGFVDEFLQFVMNPVVTNYLDFNDITLNILGAALGIAFLLAFRKPASVEQTTYERRFKLVFLRSMGFLALIVAVAFLLGRVVMVADHVQQRRVFDVVGGKLSFIMSFERHDLFWQKSYFGKVFHILSPLQGLVTAATLSACFWWSTRQLKASAETVRANEQRRPL